MNVSYLFQKFLSILAISTYLVGCHPVQHDSSIKPFAIWNYSDVRLLDPIDTDNPEQDLIAFYTKIENQYFQIRMDFLIFDFPSIRDIYIPIDTNPGGLDQIKTKNNGIINVDINWDYLLIIPAAGKIEIVNSFYSTVKGLELFVLLDPKQDKIILSFNQNKLPEISNLTKLQVFLTLPDQVSVIDQTKPISNDAPSPSRVKILFAFWNSFHSSTPAETLRSWAGAHSGPMSSRHGLKYLLEAADNYKFPLFMTDLSNSETMSALDYIGVIPLIRYLEVNNVLLLDIDNKDSIINPYFIYSNDNVYIIGNNGYANNYNELQNCMSFPTPFDKVFISELLLNCKVQLVSQGLSPSNTPIFFGGDFQASMLGDPSIINELFSYIYNHPWIQVLSIYDFQPYIKNVVSIQHYPSNNYVYLIDKLQLPSDQYSSKYSQTKHDVYSDLMDTPENQISSLAVQVFKYLINPGSPELISLGANYIGQVGHIIEAAKWFENPFSITTCNIDLDYDGEYECILANDNIFMTIEPTGGYIPFIFTRDINGAHQIVGPTWEFMLGLSDPSAWDLTHGIMSDPGQILGAFVDSDINNKHNFYLFDKSIIIYNEVMTMRKSFSIIDNSILVRVQIPDSSGLTPRIPLVLDPWTLETSGWANNYINTITSEGILWEIKSAVSVQIRSMNQLYIYPFNDTKAEIAIPEDPNFDYGRGAYLPFPMALVEFHSNEGYDVDIIINP